MRNLEVFGLFCDSFPFSKLTCGLYRFAFIRDVLPLFTITISIEVSDIFSRDPSSDDCFSRQLHYLVCGCCRAENRVASPFG